MRALPALLAALLACALTVTVAPPADAATCPSPGGQPIVRSTTQSGDFVVVGGGWGHGVGMSQYGAKGAASLGCNRDQILRAYYPGTTMGTSIPRTVDNLRVSLIPAGPSGGLASFVDVTAVSDRIPWRLRGAVRRQPAGRTWRAYIGADGRYTVKQGRSRILGPARGPLRIRLGGKIVHLPVKAKHYNRGVLRLTWSRAGARTFVTAAFRRIDPYLYGLAEMPGLWPAAALQAQAVAGRSYALQKRENRNIQGSRWKTCRCDLYDSVADQAYAAYGHESAAPAWVAAVNATAGRTLRYGDSTVAAFYNSSSGGYVESSQFVFGGALGYSKPVDDSRWERASGNPNMSWVRTFTARQVGRAFGVGTATAVETPDPKGESGRIGSPALGAGGVIVRGTNGTKLVSGSDFRIRLGLRSNLFRVHRAPAS